MPRSIPAAPRDFFHQYGRGTGAGSASDQQIRFLIRYGGRLELPLLSRAVRSVVDDAPILRARLVEPAPFEGRWEVSEDELPEPSVSEVAEAEGEAAIAAFLADEEVRDEGPYVRLRVVRAGGRDALCFRVDHRLCDGAGTKLLAYRLSEAYRRLAAGEPLPPPRGELRSRTLAGITGLPLPPPPPAPPQREGRYSYAVPRRGFANERPAHAVRVVEAATVAAMRRAGEALSATVTDVLLTALERALGPHWIGDPGAPLLLLVSADVRSRLPPGTPEVFCNLFQTLFPGLRHEPGVSFRAALSRTAASMGVLRAGFTLENALQTEAGFAAASWRYARLPPVPKEQAAREQTLVLLSNVGVIDADRLELGAPAVLDAQLLGTVALLRELLVTASTFRGALTLTVGYCRSDLDPAVPQGILDRMAAELGAFAAEG